MTLVIPLILNIFVSYIVLDATAKVLLLLEPETRQYRIIIYSILLVAGIAIETGVLAICILNRLSEIPCEVIYPKYYYAFFVVWLAFSIASLAYFKGGTSLAIPYPVIIFAVPHTVAFRRGIPKAVKYSSLGMLIYSILWLIGLIVRTEETVILGIIVRDVGIMFGFRFGRS